MKNLYLVDASNMFFRAFFAIPPLTNDKGMPTNALYGFLAMSLKLIREVKPERFYLDEEVWQAVSRMRRRVSVAVLALMVLLIIGVLAVKRLIA